MFVTVKLWKFKTVSVRVHTPLGAFFNEVKSKCSSQSVGW